MNLPNIGAMYQDAAKGLGGMLVCDHCHHSIECPERDAAGYLYRGWPKCCGYTMRLVTRREQAENLRKAGVSRG